MIVRTKESKFIDEVEDFRAERVGLLTGNQQPITLNGGARLVLHVVPSNALNGSKLDVAIFDVKRDDLKPMAVGGWNHEVNFDGIAAVTSSQSYTQLFHDGTIEAVNVSYFERRDNQSYIPLGGWEDQLIEQVTSCINIERSLKVGLPIFVMVSLLGVKGYQMMVNNGYPRSEGRKIDRDNLLVPALEIASFGSQVDEVLRPIFNRLWNAAGLRASLNYDGLGKRKRR